MNAEIMMESEQIGSPSVEEGCGGSSSGGGSALKKGPWTSIEDAILIDYVRKQGEGNWNSVQKHSGLSRCGKSCRLRWANHLRPNLKKGAFSVEEERLIIELHAKLGNKWARMATHLPGRTDNEIKNYWNTRIKRRQRAGLPLYPPPLCFQASNYSQNNHIENEFSCYYKEKNEKTIGIPSILLDNIKGNRGNVPYAPPFPENSFRSMMGQSCGSQPSGFMNQVTNHLKQLQEPQPLLPSFPGSFANGFSRLDQLSDFSRNACRTLGMVYPPDSDPNCRNLNPFEGSTSGSHALQNGKFSASKPITGDLMLELPSFQYPETDSSSWLAYPSAPLQPIQTHVQPPPVTVPDCASSHNSGLLEDLLHEAKTFCNSNNQPSARSSNCSTPLPSSIAESSLPGSCETGWEEFNDPISPLGCSAASIFSESTTPISGFLFNEYLPSKVASGAGLIQVTADDCPTPNIGKNEAQPGFMRPDSLLETDCPEDITEAAKNQTILNNVLATLLSDDFHGERQPIGTSSMLDNSGELDSCPWNNMPNFQLSNFS